MGTIQRWPPFGKKKKSEESFSLLEEEDDSSLDHMAELDEIEPLDLDPVEELPPAKPEKMSIDDYKQALVERLGDLQKRKLELEQLLTSGDYEEQPDFDAEAELAMLQAWKPYDKSGSFGLESQQMIEKIVGSAKVSASNKMFLGAKGSLKGQVEKGSSSIDAEGAAEFFAGASQEGELSFVLDNKYADVVATLNQAMKAGVWGEAEAKFGAGLKGLSAEARAYIAAGGALKVKGSFDAQTKKGGIGLVLDGEGNAFVGAEAGAEASFSASAIKGIGAGFKASAFAGARADVSGTAMFKLRGKPLFGIKGTAGVSYGAGGEVEAKMKIPLFGNSEFSFSATAALGLGTNAGAGLIFNFGNIGLVAKQLALEAKNYKAVSQGYSSELMVNAMKVKADMTKLIKAYGAEVKSVQSEITKIKKTPSEKRSLLK